MLNLRRFSSLALLLAVALIPASLAMAAEAEASPKDLLREGISQVKDGKFASARATLEQIDPSALSAGNQRTLGEYLTKAKTGQAAAAKAAAAAAAAAGTGEKPPKADTGASTRLIALLEARRR